MWTRAARLAGALLAILCFSGCASIVSGHNQSISVVSKNQGADLNGARCSLENNKGIWYATTPGSVTVRRSYQDLKVNCVADGVDPGLATVKSSTKPMAFGNILFGGIIGAGVDIGTGAAYDYPELITVHMGQGPAPAGPTAAAPAPKTAPVVSAAPPPAAPAPPANPPAPAAAAPPPKT